MPTKKWDTHDELKLLLTIIGITNPKVPGAAWPKVAAIMGSGFTAEAVRQKFNLIKRGAKDTPSTPTTTTTTDPASTASANKRKHAVVDDDEEDLQPYSVIKKVRKVEVKQENEMQGVPFGAEVFKLEEEDSDGGVNLENDDFYDA